MDESTMLVAQGVLSPEELKAIKEQANPGAAAPAQKEEPVKKEEPVTQDEPVQKDEQVKPDLLELDISNPFASADLTKAEKKVVLSTIEDVKAHAKTLGVEINDIGDFSDVFADLVKYKTEAQEAEIFKTKAANFEQVFNSLPEDLAAAVNAHLNGQDYAEVLKTITSSSFDFRKKFEEQNNLALVNHYTEGSLDAETWEQTDDQTKEALLKVAKRAYVADQKEYKESLERPQRTAQEFNNKFVQSVELSLNQLRAKYPSLTDPQIARVRNILTAELHDTLFNSDNTYKPEAAERIAFQEFGKPAVDKLQMTIGQLKEHYEKQAESKAAEIALRKSDRPSTEDGKAVSDSVNQVKAVVDQHTSFLNKT